MVTLFHIVAAIFGAAAVYFFLSENTDAAFLTLVLGLCSFFLSLRFKAKTRIESRRVPDEQTDR